MCYRLLLGIIVLFYSVSAYGQDSQEGQGPSGGSLEIKHLRDSLDAINYDILERPMVIGKWKILKIRNQGQWNSMTSVLKSLLDKGFKNIEVKVTGKNIEFGLDKQELTGLDYPDANIRIVGNRAKMISYGLTFSKRASGVRRKGGFYLLPNTKFGLNDIITDSKGNEVPIREETQQVKGEIEKAPEIGNDVWRFKVDLQDLNGEQCKDFYVFLTRDWTSARHKVVKVQDGWLYYHLDSSDLHSDCDPNVDWIRYKIRPRYILINSPVSKQFHIAEGWVYIPMQYKSVRINKGGQLLEISKCNFNSLEISGFKLNGCGEGIPFRITNCVFSQGAFIHNNKFENMSSFSIKTTYNTNLVISNNTVKNTRIQAIEGWGTNTHICGNYLKNIGWVLNTRAITGGGEYLHICDNVIEDFNYAAIACGSTEPNAKARKLTYIIERNLIRYTDEYAENYMSKTQADGGAIYIGPQCIQGIIRYNVVENIKGIHSNRGIFLDDGAKNLAIYGNLVLNTANSYDIDLRYCNTYATGIPDHNTNNCLFDNILTGTYRFQDGGEGSNCVEGENRKVQGVQEIQEYKKKFIKNWRIRE